MECASHYKRYPTGTHICPYGWHAQRLKIKNKTGIVLHDATKTTGVDYAQELMKTTMSLINQKNNLKQKETMITVKVVKVLLTHRNTLT